MPPFTPAPFLQPYVDPREEALRQQQALAFQRLLAQQGGAPPMLAPPRPMAPPPIARPPMAAAPVAAGPRIAPQYPDETDYGYAIRSGV